MSEKTLRDLLEIATDESWLQMGSRLIARCEGTGRSRNIVEALREFGIEADTIGVNAVEVSTHALQGLDASKAATIKDYLTNGEAEARPRKDQARAR